MEKILPYRQFLKVRSRVLRNNMTKAETLLWKEIRYRKLYGIQFFRQKPIGNYILDFYAKNPSIAIELDGPIHFTSSALAYDKNRDHYLSELGIHVLRFTNSEVTGDIDKVITKIKKVICLLSPP